MEKKYTNWELLTDTYFTGYEVLVNYQGLLWKFIEYDCNANRVCFYNSMQGLMWVDRDDPLEGLEIISIEKLAPHFKLKDRVRGKGVISGIVSHVTETSCTVKDCDGQIKHPEIEHLEHDHEYYIKGLICEKGSKIENLVLPEGGFPPMTTFHILYYKLNEVIDKLNEYERGNNKDK